MKTKSARFNFGIHVFCAGLVLIQPVSSSADENLKSGIELSQGQVESAITVDDETSADWKMVGECQMAGDSNCVLDLLDKIIKEDLEAWEAYALRAEVREVTGDLVGAERDKRALAGVGGAYAAIDSRLSQEIDLNPGDPDLVWQRAVHRWRLGNDVAAALADLDLLVSLSDEPAPQKVYMMRAKLREVQSDYDGAINDYSAVIELESGYESTALTERARLLGMVGRAGDAELDLEVLAETDKITHDERLKSLTKRIEVHPEDILSIYMRGMEYADRDDLGAALRDAETIIRIAPDSWMGYSLRSKVRRKQGDITGYREDRAMVKELSQE